VFFDIFRGFSKSSLIYQQRLIILIWHDIGSAFILEAVRISPFRKQRKTSYSFFGKAFFLNERFFMAGKLSNNYLTIDKDRMLHVYKNKVIERNSDKKR
jgi:hypothetical protein